MDAKEIRELIELVSRSRFSTFEFEGDGFRIKLVRDPAGDPATHGVTAPAAAAPPPAPAAEASAGAETAETSDLVLLRSPIVGTFYRAASPGAAPFTEIGARVQKGQVLCIVEAMKVMNEIESEIDAEVVEIPVADRQPVEYGEVLVRLRPLAS